MVKVVRILVLGDRTGSWSTHLSAIAEYLPMFAATGHFNYMKSAYLYLQSIKEFETWNQAVFRNFQRGFHVIRRTEKFWVGLGTDFVLKSTGGLTRGSGMTEEKRSLWTISSPVCSEYNISQRGNRSKNEVGPVGLGNTWRQSIFGRWSLFE